MKVWVVVIEQVFASYYAVIGVCDNEERAKEIAGSSPDAHIYTTTMNEKGYVV